MLRAAMRTFSRTLSALAVLSLGALGVGCSPDIGDSCQTSVDCSVNGDRICDRTQPRGYCTISGCEPDTCPGNNLCVEWRGMPDRTSATYCMDPCQSDGDCRNDYICVRDDDPRMREGYPSDLDTPLLTRIIDLNAGRAERSFCVADPDSLAL